MCFQYATGMCLLLENVGGYEQNRSVANVQSDDLWPSRMHAATHILHKWRVCMSVIILPEQQTVKPIKPIYLTVRHLL